ncbi:MAG: tetratricopeptide repeat protein [Gemmatimonadetes bacterium]|nr:tetratricopeptide repeat protein [Gemmatimonadota bacterium]
MIRLGGMITLTALALPVAAAAQNRPSNSMHTRSAEVYLERAKSASRTAERDELLTKALEVLTEGMKSDAGNPKVWFLAGQAYTRLGDVAGADSAFDRAETLYPEYAAETGPERMALWVNKYNAGIAALQRNDEAGALAEFVAADQIYRGRPEATVSMGSLYARMGDLANAEAAYRTTLEIVRGPASRELDAEARAEWQEQESTAALLLADLLTQTGKAAAALEVLETLVQRQPQNASARSALAGSFAAAGRTDDATRIYEELVTGDDLTETELFNTGVRLYQANRYDLATRAFTRAVGLNPWSRDIQYNLGQTIYAAASELEKQRDAAPESERAALDARLRSLYEDLGDVGTRLTEIDPQQRSTLMMVAQSQRSLGELITDPAAAQEYKSRVLAALEAADAMTFEVTGVQLTATDETATVRGNIHNLKLSEGQSVTLAFRLVDATGREVAVRNVTVRTPAPETSVEFAFDVQTTGPAAAWTYRVSS